MLTEIDKSKDIMIAQIIKEMNGNVQLPVCMKLIDYLRQTNRFSEEQLRVTFLLVCNSTFLADWITKIIFQLCLGTRCLVSSCYK